AYAYVRGRVLRAALAGERPRRIGPLRLRPLPLRPGFFPRVLGLRLFPRSGGADELALDQALSEVTGAGRAAYVLRGMEGLTDAEVRRTLTVAEVPDPSVALADADMVRGPAGSRDRSLLASAEFDPCTLQARPTDLMRRRQHGRAALAAVAAVLLCGALLGLPGDSWGQDGAAAPAYARNAAAEKALDPRALTQVSADAWRRASRADFAAWPARGDLTDDRELLRRALAVWARPGEKVTVSATRGTPEGPPSGPPQLLFAGRVDGAAVVLLHDGLRVARYAEPEGAQEGGAVLDLARTDGADTASSGALVLSRSETDVRYLTAPWVARAAEADLTRPGDSGRPLDRDKDGVLEPIAGPGGDPGSCDHWPGLLLTTRGRSAPHLYTDLGELTPPQVTAGAPGLGARDATGPEARAGLARTACGLRAMSGGGVRSVNSWEYARQSLPDGAGEASWVCTRAETWRGAGAQVLAGFRPPAGKPAEPAVVTARATDSPACGKREPRVLSGVLWKSPAAHWYVLAAGSPQVTGLRVRGPGGLRGVSATRTLTLPARQGAKAKLTGRLANGERLRELH
ncbi:MAG: hypothetical protein ACRDP3_22700, partial [Streptomyces sp.]|uniref:hypothetical protein n=1 Tax=Streptomyces sp. TaxID=1931 RepID=UPI003D6AD674